MKKNLLLGCLLTFSLALCGQEQAGKENKGCIIHGELEGVYKAKKVYLVEEECINGPSRIIDSCDVVNNTYTFTIQDVPFPRMYFIQSADPECLSPISPFFAEQGEVKIHSNAQFFLNCRASGTPNNEIFAAYNAEIAHLRDSVNRSARIDRMLNRNQSQEAQVEAFKHRTDLNNDRSLFWQEQLVRRYYDQAIAPFMIFWEMKANLKLEQLKVLRTVLDPKLDAHPYTKQLDEFIRLADFKVGSEMPDFKLPDLNGKDFMLSSLKGKYVLVDFWASWCGPCIREMPHVVKLYKACKGKNFEIVGVSLDKDKKAWQNAVKTNKMQWIQVSDLQGWATPVVKACNISAVPFTVLVGPDGKVRALNLRGEELITKVKEIIRGK